MKKFFLQLLLLILLAHLILAETQTVEKMNIGSKSTVNGKTITILDATRDGNIKVEVDGKKDFLKFGDFITEINGMRVRILNFTYIDESFIQTTLEITVDAKCGDGICDMNMSESNESCCKDCGCTIGKCLNNICKIIECNEDKDCDDNDPCTTEKCTQEQKCEITTITECKTSDGCCPTGCAYKNDEDCEFLGTCETDSECNDNNSCTTDKCEGKPLSCTNQPKKGCDFKGVCHDINKRVENMYCTEEGLKQQKKNLERCDNDYECLENQCHNNLCGKKSNKNMIIGLVIASIIFILLTFASYYLFKKKE